MRHLHITLGPTARTARTGLRRWFTMTDAPAIAQGPVGPDHPEHPDHSLFAQIREAVSVLDAELGKPFDEASERMAARELPLATQHGVDQVLMWCSAASWVKSASMCFWCVASCPTLRICVRTSPRRKPWRHRWMRRLRSWMRSTGG